MDETQPPTLASLLHAARGQRTLRSVALVAGVSERSIRWWESGELPKLTLLLRLLGAYRVSVPVHRAILDAHMREAVAAARVAP